MNAATETVHPLAREENLIRVYVWEWPVRITHWVIFVSIFVLGFTGYYMYDPFIISRGKGAFLMGTMRFTHEVTGFVFIAAVLVRIYWFFQGNRWARWTGFVSADRWWRRGLRKQLSYYLFLQREPDSEVGHNPLAAATYVVVYALMVVEILTGLALFQHITGGRVLGFFIGWLPSLVSIRNLRLIHFLILFALLAFMIHHVYSAVLIGIEERSGLVGGIFSGYKFLPAAFVAADPTRRPHEERIPAVRAGRPHRARKGGGQGGTKLPAVSTPRGSGEKSRG